MLERLVVRPELAAFEPAVRERVDRLGAMDEERIAKPRAIERDHDGALVVVSEFVPGSRLSDLLGGAKQMMIGNLVQNQFAAARNWPFGSAASFIVMALVLVAVMIYLRFRDANDALAGDRR